MFRVDQRELSSSASSAPQRRNPPPHRWNLIATASQIIAASELLFLFRRVFRPRESSAPRSRQRSTAYPRLQHSCHAVPRQSADTASCNVRNGTLRHRRRRLAAHPRSLAPPRQPCNTSASDAHHRTFPYRFLVAGTLQRLFVFHFVVRQLGWGIVGLIRHDSGGNLRIGPPARRIQNKAPGQRNRTL